MKPKSYLAFKLAKAIMASCETESELRDVIFFLKSPQDLDVVSQMLESFVSQLRLPKAKEVSFGNNAMMTEKLSDLISKLRNEGLSVRDVEFLIMKVFNKRISSNKVGLEKYIQKLSHDAIFQQAYNYFMSKNRHNSTSEDPWLKEMLNEQKKRDDAHK